MRKKNPLNLTTFLVISLLIIGVVIALGFYRNSLKEVSPSPDKMVQVGEQEEMVDGIHVATGLIEDKGLNLVIGHCTGCHSAKLVTQNRFNREGWIRVIRWMQETQNLWDLGESETEIVDYLTRNYAPELKGRRLPLQDIQWYELKEE